MEKKQPAVEWLALQLPIGLRESFSKEIEHAIQLEREQIEDAYSTYAFDEHGMRIHASQYYNETFGGQDE